MASTFAVLPLAASLLLSGAAFSAEVRIGYLGLKDDPRYHPDVVYTRIEIAPGGNPIDGATMGVEELKVVSDAVDQQVVLDHQEAADAAALVAKVNEMAAAGEQFIILDLPADLVDQVAAATKDQPVTLVNATAPEDYLRSRCYPNLLHTAASDRMLSDAMVQLLRTRNWTKVLMLVGPEARDKSMAAAFRASAERLRLNIVDEREFTLATDPANRDKNNTLLVTGNADYDLVFVADHQGEFARYLPYDTQLPRLVVGSTGLVASEWQWSWDRDGSTQVTSRFETLTDGRRMTGQDWSTWIAAKAVVTAYAKARTGEYQKTADYIRGNRLKIDGAKGVQLNFRPWDGQMRFPIVLATHNAVIAEAPLEGFLHETNTLDTLGTDQPEHTCQ
ncbi:amino acid ABC transporter substrate-binding protein [Devosia sp. ZB163]|uniref:amino acid ABC transporter substrate-binding protein n=1 Tax=Devosia sp. ZB163 TaxID=3025938 RepID=UPI00235E0C67|nr:amino acid ABC transporter substrate-binding protein [Devosia sp. ZB163]MDC9822288.1 amino acid ABC transporter substrate-binding protein [Devosia sp. ZB163]